ncbi:hypothetical protein Tco_0659964 [Tanacetum coccineum]
MSSGNRDRDTLSKLLQMGTELLRSKPPTLGEAFSLARITKARFEETTFYEGLFSNPCEGLGVEGTHSMAGTKRIMCTDNEVGGDDSKTSDPDKPTKEVVDSKNGSTLTSLVGYESPRSLQLWKKMGIDDVIGPSDSGDTYNFVQPNAEKFRKLKELDKESKDKNVERDAEKEGEPNILATFGSDRGITIWDLGIKFFFKTTP